MRNTPTFKHYEKLVYQHVFWIFAIIATGVADFWNPSGYFALVVNTNFEVHASLNTLNKKTPPKSTSDICHFLR